MARNVSRQFPCGLRSVVNHEAFHLKPVVGYSETLAHIAGGLKSRKGSLSPWNAAKSYAHLWRTRPDRALVEHGVAGGIGYGGYKGVNSLMPGKQEDNKQGKKRSINMRNKSAFLEKLIAKDDEQDAGRGGAILGGLGGFAGGAYAKRTKLFRTNMGKWEDAIRPGVLKARHVYPLLAATTILGGAIGRMLGRHYGRVVDTDRRVESIRDMLEAKQEKKGSIKMNWFSNFYGRAQNPLLVARDPFDNAVIKAAVAQVGKEFWFRTKRAERVADAVRGSRVG